MTQAECTTILQQMYERKSFELLDARQLKWIGFDE